MEILNKEEEDAEAVLEVRLLGRSKDTLGYSWIRDARSPMKELPAPLDIDPGLPGHVVGKLSRGEKTIEKIRFTAPPEPADHRQLEPEGPLHAGRWAVQRPVWLL